MDEGFLKKLKQIILISALALLVGYFGINGLNELFIWFAESSPANYQANLSIQDINSTNISSTLKSIAISEINSVQQSLYTGFVTTNKYK